MSVGSEKILRTCNAGQTFRSIVHVISDSCRANELVSKHKICLKSPYTLKFGTFQTFSSNNILYFRMAAWNILIDDKILV